MFKLNYFSEQPDQPSEVVRFIQDEQHCQFYIARLTEKFYNLYWYFPQPSVKRYSLGPSC